MNVNEAMKSNDNGDGPSQLKLEQSSNKDESIDSDPNQVQIILNDTPNFQNKLENFRSICEYHEKNRRRSCKKRFYDLGLVARVTDDTTDEDLSKLLNNGARTFMFDSVSINRPKLSELVDLTLAAVEVYQSEQPRKHIVAGLAIEIKGDCCRLGRCRNDCSIMLSRGDVITLTIDEAYKWCGFKEVCYAVNLKHYIKNLRLHDVLKIGREAEGRVVKKLNVNIAVFIDMPGLINSFEYIELPKQCNKRSQLDVISMFIDDLILANELDAHYIVMPKIRCKPFLEALRNHMTSDFSTLKLIGSIDFEYVGARGLDLWGIIRCLDYLWIDDFFQSSCLLKAHICQCAIPKAKCLNKPIIGSVPLQCCSQFKCFSNELFLWKLDSIFIEKSGCCCKYPLIVRKLLPRNNLRRDATERRVSVKNLTDSYQSRITCIIHNVVDVDCQAIFLHINCEAATEVFNCIDVCCPIYVILPWDSVSSDQDDLSCMLKLARTVNLRRNSRSILYSKEMNENNLTPVYYGIDYAFEKGCISTGDFIITVELIQQAAEDSKTENTDVAILRAFYLP